MYCPEFNKVDDQQILADFIRQQIFGVWAVNTQSGLIANGIPFFLRTDTQGQLTLVGHVARANPVWQACLEKSSESLVVFQGANSYISPSMYPSKKEHGRAVPTWNYIMVEARGVARVHQGVSWLRSHVEELTQHLEQNQAEPWHISDAPEDFTAKLIKGIVGIEIPLDTLTGKWKLGQNRSEIDQQGIIASLAEKADDDAVCLAGALREHVHLTKG